jgi:hypothetical protein
MIERDKDQNLTSNHPKRSTFVSPKVVHQHHYLPTNKEWSASNYKGSRSREIFKSTRSFRHLPVVYRADRVPIGDSKTLGEPTYLTQGLAQLVIKIYPVAN